MEGDPAGKIFAKACLHQLYAVGFQIIFGKFGIEGTGIPVTLISQTTAEQFGHQPLLLCAAAAQTRNETGHRNISIAVLLAWRDMVAAAWQHEMVHAADPCNRIINAGADARSQHGAEQGVSLDGDQTLAAKQMNGFKVAAKLIQGRVAFFV